MAPAGLGLRPTLHRHPSASPPVPAPPTREQVGGPCAQPSVAAVAIRGWGCPLLHRRGGRQAGRPRRNQGCVSLRGPRPSSHHREELMAGPHPHP